MRIALVAAAVLMCSCASTMAGRFTLRVLCEAASQIGKPKCTSGQPCGNSCISWSDTCHIEDPCDSIQVVQDGAVAAADAVPGLDADKRRDQEYNDCLHSFRDPDVVESYCFDKVYGEDPTLSTASSAIEPGR